MFPSEKTVGVANRKEEEEGVNQNIMLLVNFCGGSWTGRFARRGRGTGSPAPQLPILFLRMCQETRLTFRQSTPLLLPTPTWFLHSDQSTPLLLPTPTWYLHSDQRLHLVYNSNRQKCFCWLGQLGHIHGIYNFESIVKQRP